MAHEDCTAPVYLGEADFIGIAKDESEHRAARAGFPNVYGAIKRCIGAEVLFAEQCIQDDGEEFRICGEALRAVTLHKVDASGFSDNNPHTKMQRFFRKAVIELVDGRKQTE